MRMTSRERRALTPLMLIPAIAALSCGTPEPPAPPPRAITAADIRLIPETLLIRDVVPRSTTLESLLTGHGVETTMAGRVIDAVRSVFDPRRLRSLQPFMLERTMEGALRVFEYEIDAQSFLRVAAVDVEATRLTAEVLPIPRTREQAVASGVIDRNNPSLYGAMTAAGEASELAIRLADVFSGEIDFNSEVQLGDRFVVLYERFRRQDGGETTYGDVLAAEWRPADGKAIRAIFFTPTGGKPGRYDEQGRSLRRFFLKSPLPFDPRVTSGFSSRRMHPVLHTARAHRGVDYAAPTGAPVIAVASGTVMSVTYDSSNGRMVRLRHASGYQTYYLHLSRFASGIHAGGRVDQGQVIGYVGSTGLATGPHLHYGLTKNGAFVNPVAEHRKMPPGEPVPAADMPAFIEARDRMLAALAAAEVPSPSPRTASLATPADAERTVQ